MSVLIDSFTDTDSTAIASHHETGGPTWGDLSSSGTVTIQSNKASNSSGDARFGFQAGFAPGGFIQAKFWTASGDVGLFVESKSGGIFAQTGAIGIWSPSSNWIQLMTFGGGLASSALATAWTNGDELKLIVNGFDVTLAHIPQTGTPTSIDATMASEPGNYLGIQLSGNSQADDFAWNSGDTGTARPAPLLHSHSNRWPRNNTLLRM